MDVSQRDIDNLNEEIKIEAQRRALMKYQILLTKFRKFAKDKLTNEEIEALSLL